MTSLHYANDRADRQKLIKQIGFGKPVGYFKVDRRHRNGAEIHVVTSTGLILIYNQHSKKFVTALIARPQQIKRYYEAVGQSVPSDIVELAVQHERAGYNRI